MSLTDKIVLITGGGTGIGADAARGFLEAGAKVVLNGRRGDVLAQTAARLDPTGASVATVVGDIGQADTRRRLIETALKRFGGVDILFNNAGVFETKPLLEVTESDFARYLNLVQGYYFMAQAAIPEMRKRGGGAIINTGSMWAETRLPPRRAAPRPPQRAGFTR